MEQQRVAVKLLTAFGHMVDKELDKVKLYVNVHEDLLTFLNNIVPEDTAYKHMAGNSDSHIKSSIIGCSLNILINDGKLILGSW